MKLHYQRCGSGQPVIIVHGLFGSADNWRTIAADLSDKADVITIDLRNHGQSPHSPVMTYQAMADDIIELIQALNLTQVDCIGHSVGGKVVMTLSERYPQWIRKMAIVDIAPKTYPPAHTSIFNALNALDLTRYHHRRELDNELVGAIPDKTVRQFLLMNVEKSQNQLRWRINLSVLQHNYPELLQAVCSGKVIDLPCLFIRGGRSSYITDEDEKVIRCIFPKAHIATIDEAGHWVHVQEPKAFLAIITEFFDYD